MNTIENICRYIGYIVISVLLGWASDISSSDFIEKITTSIIPILLTLTVLNTTLTNLTLNELLKYKASQPAQIGTVIDELKRSAVIELGLIVLTFIVLIIEGVITQWIPIIAEYKGIFINALVAFDILYFVLVIYDNINGWYKLIKENAKS